ncbi:unnamed protein product [Lasius platythorax]|uniref:Nuclease HARBI1 n=1 Tax=Lasius platythorax TaxID=488582 RepID=A0AAV2NSF8_9HYME
MRRRIRDMSDSFVLPEREFIGMYCLTKDLARALIEQLEPYLPVRRRSIGIPIELRVLCALSFYAQGSYQKAVGVDQLCIAQSTVSIIIKEVTSAINQYLLRQYVQFSMT